MVKAWSWEEEDFIGEDEPIEYPLVVTAQICDVCHLPHTEENPVVFACDACGNATHVDCGSDTEPSGGYDRDPDENYWLCHVCLGDWGEPVGETNSNDPAEMDAYELPGRKEKTSPDSLATAG